MPIEALVDERRAKGEKNTKVDLHNESNGGKNKKK